MKGKTDSTKQILIKLNNFLYLGFCAVKSFQDICLIWSSLMKLFIIVEKNYDAFSNSSKSLMFTRYV